MGTVSAYSPECGGVAMSTAESTVANCASGRSGGARRLDVIVLAGGTARRLGGASKPDVLVSGVRLLDHVLSGIEHVRAQLPPGRVVVVAPPTVAVPAGVLQTLEDPPLGGPVAGIAAGLVRLAAAEKVPTPGPVGSTGDMSGGRLTAVVTCDAPESWRLLPELTKALEGRVGGDGACIVDGDHVQYLLGVYRTAVLAAAVAPGGVGLRDVAVRRVLNGLDLVRVDLAGRGETLSGAAHDLDTWEDIRTYSRRDR
ncbi:MobA-like NTP transferase domain protein [Actinomyces succiniciruminis]|uniref:MobA-like NTP transferase domain protein n=2 Tax=Actinomyces succiniciruminis TaxID=1522002 RepID=A0A1L7RHI3_9ACTO|nr:MobA-like NTP transferase domain protein [Actinomyces succiniciruminis]